MLKSILQESSFLSLLLWISGALFIISLVRIFVLKRQNIRMTKDAVKMQKMVAEQQIRITATRHDAASWRAKAQRQFDALRAEMAAKLDQSVQSNQHAQKKLDEVLEQEKERAHAKINELEVTMTAHQRQMSAAQANPSMPILPAMETLRIEALEAELAATKSAFTALHQQNAALRLSTMVARRRQSTTRRGAVRSVRHN